MTNREEQLIEAAIAYSNGMLMLEQLKACVIALQVERHADAEEELIDHIVEQAKRPDSSRQRLYMIRLAIKRHDEHWRVVLGETAE